MAESEGRKLPCTLQLELAGVPLPQLTFALCRIICMSVKYLKLSINNQLYLVVTFKCSKYLLDNILMLIQIVISIGGI